MRVRLWFNYNRMLVFAGQSGSTPPGWFLEWIEWILALELFCASVFWSWTGIGLARMLNFKKVSVDSVDV